MPVDPRTLPLVQASDVSYVGEFPFSTNWFPDSPNYERLDEGGHGLGMGPDGHSLYIGGYTGYQRLARISIPPTMGTPATIVQQATPIVPSLQTIDPGESSSAYIGGTLLWNGFLYLTAYIYYDGDSSAYYSHFKGQPDISGFTGPYRVVPSVFRPADVSNGWTPQRYGVGWTNGYMTSIPQEWRALLGGPCLTGQSNIAIVSRTSYGPSISVIDPEDIGVPELATTTLCGYPPFMPREEIFGTFDTMQVVGVAFPPGTRTIMFIGRKGLGQSCYGPGTTDPALHFVPTEGGTYCYDPLDGSKGYHAWPYRHFMWLYDVNDLLEVKAGIKNAWEVVPYLQTAIPGGPSATDGNATSYGACFDPATGRLYLAPNYQTIPKILVWQLNVGTPPIPELVATVRGAATLSGTLHVGIALASVVTGTASILATIRPLSVFLNAVVTGSASIMATLRPSAASFAASATAGALLTAVLTSVPDPIEPPVEPPTEQVVGHYKACLDIVIIRVNEPRS